MERRKFVKNCCYTAIGIPVLGSVLSSCGSIFYATATTEKNKLVVKKSAFVWVKKEKEVIRDFVLVKTDSMEFPISLYKMDDDTYSASVMRCTHRGCELNVGGGIYTCPCHGSEFSTSGKVLEGPAEKDLTTYKTETDHEHIYILHA